jgi:hypothetical protein
MMITTELEDHIQKAVDHNIPPLDIMHGELKNLMLEAEEHLHMCIEREEKSGEAADSIDRGYAEGYLDALVQCYHLTYNLSFAIADRDKELTAPLDFGNIEQTIEREE